MKQSTDSLFDHIEFPEHELDINEKNHRSCYEISHVTIDCGIADVTKAENRQNI